MENVQEELEDMWYFNGTRKPLTASEKKAFKSALHGRHANKDVVLEGIDSKAFDILDDLGTRPKMIGKDNYKCLCPMHVKQIGQLDNNPSCCLKRTKIGRWYVNCYSCSGHGNLIELIEQVLGLTFSESVDYLALHYVPETLGGDWKKDVACNQKKRCPFDEETLKVIGLKNCIAIKPISNIVDYSSKKLTMSSSQIIGSTQCPFHKLNDSGYDDEIEIKQTGYSLSNFYTEDPELFKWMVIGKAKETIEKVRQAQESLPTDFEKELEMVGLQLVAAMSEYYKEVNDIAHDILGMYEKKEIKVPSKLAG
jgi:hypothetical protein